MPEKMNTLLFNQKQETVLGQRHENQKTAAFNLGVAEAIKQKKQARDTGFYVSLGCYIYLVCLYIV